MQYCPRCGSQLGTKSEGGRDRPACLTEGCGFVHFGEPSIGCGAVVMRDAKALLIQRGLPPRGTWQIPGGFVEVDEHVHNAIEREVLEESGVVARVEEAIGFRYQAQVHPDRPNSNIYVVFRLAPISGQPNHDGEESLAAGYFSLEELTQMENVQGLSLWAIRLALAAPKGAGLVLHQADGSVLRPGGSLFGLPVDAGPKTTA
jgi:ADP-ribose pyrophosphatase YjhB (NUDIX family)